MQARPDDAPRFSAPADSPTRAALFPPRLDDEAFLASMTSSVVLVEVLGTDAAVVGRGSAFFVTGDRLLTCWHVVSGASDARILFAGGDSLPITGVEWFDVECDLALLAIGTPGVVPTPLRLSALKPTPGERVIVVGPPVPGDPVCVASYGRAPMDADGLSAGRSHQFRFRAPLAPGWSGSPVLNSTGEVVGVARSNVEGIYSSASTVTLALHHVHATNRPAVRPLGEVAGNLDFGKGGGRPTPRGPSPARIVPALSAAARGDWAGAESLLRGILSESPNDAEVWEYLAALLEHRGRRKECIEAFRRLCELRPGSSEMHHALGTILLEAHEFQEAVVALREAVRLSPRDADARYGLGYAQLQLEQYDEAIAEFRRVLDIDSTYEAAKTGVRYAKARKERGY